MAGAEESQQKTPFLTGDAAEQRLREVFSGLDGDKVDLAIMANRLLDLTLTDLGIDPATMQRFEEGGEHDS